MHWSVKKVAIPNIEVKDSLANELMVDQWEPFAITDDKDFGYFLWLRKQVPDEFKPKSNGVKK